MKDDIRNSLIEREKILGGKKKADPGIAGKIPCLKYMLLEFQRIKETEGNGSRKKNFEERISEKFLNLMETVSPHT